MADEDRGETQRRDRTDAGRYTPFEQPGGPPEKPSGRGRLPVGALVAIVLGVLVLLAVLLAVLASGGSAPPNGQTTSMAPLVAARLS